MFDRFKEPNLYDRFNLKKDDVLPAGLKLSDFTIYSVTVKEREIHPVPAEEQNLPGMIRFVPEEFVVFDEKPCGTLAAVDDKRDPIGYKNTRGFWIPGPHLHLKINNIVPGFFWVGAQWTPTIAQVVEESSTGWWWLFTLRDPEKQHPGDFIRGGYVFEKEEDAICVRAALDVK